jgi:putative acyl-CoA dehydrogenase
MYLLSQAESGVMCPLSGTYAAVAALRHAPALAAKWEPRLVDIDPDTSALCGMAMTEKQGGSDVRANTTRAEPTGEAGIYELTGHKWFCSHPACDAFLVLAQAPGGLSCFLLPRKLPDGSHNAGRRDGGTRRAAAS